MEGNILLLKTPCRFQKAVRYEHPNISTIRRNTLNIKQITFNDSKNHLQIFVYLSMKKILLIIGLAFAPKSFTQNPQLLENTWHIHKLVVDGEEFSQPQVNDNFSNTLNVYTNQEGQHIFETGFCDAFGAQAWFEGDNVFTLQDDPIVLLGFCNLEESMHFSGQYIGIFYPGANAHNPFIYTITNGTGSNKLLVITNAEGDSAHYGNFMLSTPDFKNVAFTLYPNPVFHELNIQTDINVTAVKLYTTDGREVMRENLSSEQTKINLEGLSKGIYLLKLTCEDNIVYTTKVVKQ